MGETALSSITQNLFNPTFLKSFRDPFQEPYPVVYLYESPLEEPEEIELHELYPFLTIQDIKTHIYIKKGKDEKYHPSKQTLLIPMDGEPSSLLTENYIPLDFAFVEMDKKNKVLSTYSLRNPFQRIREGEVDTRFVDANGEAKFPKISDRSNNIMEDVFSEVFGPAPVILHLFLYSDLVEGIEDKLKTKKEWNGRIHPYFPDLPMEYETELETEEEQRFLQAKVTYVESTLQLMDKLNDLIEGEAREVSLHIVKMISIKYLRLLWKQPTMKTPDVESLFYQIPVTPIMPFSRILPTQSVPITKIFVESALRIPSFDPRLISQWADLKGPSKSDFMFGKVTIRREEGQEPALFGTLRIFEDRSADFLVQPPRELKKFVVRDIQEFPTLLESVIEQTYLNTVDLDIKDAAVVCQIPSVGLRQVSQAKFLRRLRAFAPLFQEIPALPNETPLAMLRYRAVSKFTAEDKIFTFLTQYNSRKVVRGEIGSTTYAADMIYAVMDTFKIRFGEADELFRKWVAEKDKIALNNAETNDFGPQYNKGVDIAVFAQQSSYSFHLYRVDSILHLRRILLALSLLLSAEDEQLEIDEEVADDFDAAASVVDEEERKDEPVGDEDLGDALGDAEGFDADELGEAVDESQEPPEEVKVPAKTILTAKPKPTMELETKAKPIREYFTKRLYDTDVSLFPASEDLGKGKAKVSTAKRVKKETEVKQTYSAKCQASHDRQPIVMSEDQYEAMLEEYREDDVSFLEFPLRETVVPKAVGEIVYVLRYGSSSLKMNYYLCSKYFCLKDFIVVLEKDFKGTQLRHPEDHDGRTEKEPNTCPFCEGSLIQDKKQPGPNEWVFQRMDGKPNKYIGLLRHTVHPKGLFQPCCFGRPPKYRTADNEFKHLSYKTITDEEVEEDREERVTVATVGTAKEPLNYALTMYHAHKKYIVVEKKKIPLEVGDKGGPQIGVLPSIVDPFFQQDDEDIVHVVKSQHALKPNSRAFLRVGVDNRQVVRAESFFSAIAPFLNLNTAEDVRTRLLERVFPRNFLFFNYGNLVLEFYNPSDARPNDTELRLWSQKNLEVELADENTEAILRLWKSYHRFRDFLNDKEALKEYRQFAQMIAMPGFLTVRGVVFTVLDIVKEGDEERLEVRCPPFGYDNQQYADADIGFLLHHHAGIWEPIFYSENELAHKQFGDRHDVTLKFQRSMLNNWPPIVQKRVLEFTQKCSGPGRAAWTSSSLVDPFALIPVSTLVQAMAQAPEGVIRDAYNHIVALTFRAEAGKSKLVAVPVVDDGTILTPARLHFDWDDYTPASLPSLVKFYRENIEPIFGYYPGYSVKYAVRVLATRTVVAVQLKNGIFIPCTIGKSDLEESRKLLETMKAIEIQEMEWSINRRILFGTDTSESKPLLQTQERKIDEAFEYLRLTFSKWYSGEEVSGELRKSVEDIIFSKKYPLFERRKRLHILLGTTILEWMDQEEEWKDEQKSLLRVDCTVSPESQCSGQCVWKSSESKCYIHVPEASSDVKVNVPEMLMWRLLEELLRLPERRRQLLGNDVSSLVTLTDPVQIKDQYIVPDSSLAWEDLKRLDMGTSTKEKKKFYEEMSSDGKPSLPKPRNENAIAAALPDEIKDMLGEGAELEGLYLYRPTLAESVMPSVQPFLVSMGLFEADIGLEEGSTIMTDDAMREFTLATHRPIIQINLQGGEISWSQFGPAKGTKDPTPFVLVAMDIDQGGPAMISLSPTSPVPVPLDRLPSGLKFLYDERTLVQSEPAKK